MLQTREVTFSYSKGASFKFPNLEALQSKPLLLLGDSGTGKTTLLHLLGGLLKPTTGHIEINGQDIASMPKKELDKFRGENIGIVFQSAHFVSSLSVLENLLLPNFLIGNSPSRQVAISNLERLGLAHRQSQKPQKLSIGEQQRAAIARAVMNSPKIILADEPTSALDDKNAFEVIKLLQEQAENSHASLIIVTHDQRLKDKFENRISL